MGKKLFDYVIGNPPYNENFDNSGDNGNYAKPVYNIFMDAADEVSQAVELIHPARFLFNAGSTPKAWNNAKLHDKHFKVLKYEPDQSKVFPDNDIKGGIAITYRDSHKDYGEIGTFTSFSELNSILKKVEANMEAPLSTIISGRGVYRLSELALKEHPEIKYLQSKGHATDVGAGAFRILNNIVFFLEPQLADHQKYVKFIGLISNKRVYRWARLDYQQVPDSFYKYKVFIPKANG